MKNIHAKKIGNLRDGIVVETNDKQIIFLTAKQVSDIRVTLYERSWEKFNLGFNIVFDPEVLLNYQSGLELLQ